jgi:hypothetical protein
MKRLFRFLHAIALTISLLLLALVVTAWVRGMTRDEEIGWVRTDLGPQLDVAWDKSGVRFEYRFWPERVVKGDTVVLIPTGSRDQIYFRTYHGTSGFIWRTISPLWNRAGFHAVEREIFSQLLVPFWFLVLLTLVHPLVSAVSFARRRLAYLPGMCKNCGYDLRMTPDRCPECGIVPTSRT